MLATRNLCCLLVLALLASCSPEQMISPAPEPEPAESASGVYRRASEQQANQVYMVDSQHSLLSIVVRRGGPLARMGHDHLIASRDLHGFVLINNREHSCRADLTLPLQTLRADEPALREKAGLTTQPTAEDIAATRSNMFAHVLDLARYPQVVIAIRQCPEAAAEVLALVTLNGVERTVPLTMQLETDSTGLKVQGTATVRQSDFGIQPFAVMGGLLKVEDSLDIQFSISAGRLPLRPQIRD